MPNNNIAQRPNYPLPTPNQYGQQPPIYNHHHQNHQNHQKPNHAQSPLTMPQQLNQQSYPPPVAAKPHSRASSSSGGTSSGNTQTFQPNINPNNNNVNTQNNNSNMNNNNAVSAASNPSPKQEQRLTHEQVIQFRNVYVES